MPDVRRVAFLRSVEIQRAAPHIQRLDARLRATATEARLFYTDGSCGPGDFPGTSEKLPADASPGQIAERIRRWGADACISISLRDENALRDALVAGELAAGGVSTVMHGAETTGMLANKADTKAFLRRAGICVPDDVLVDGDVLNGRTVPMPGYRDYVIDRADRIGFPLLGKPLWDSFGNGLRFLGDRAALVEHLDRPPDGTIMLERCLHGELCSVEIIGREGVYQVQPLVWKGTTGGEPSFLFGSLRYAGPGKERERQFEDLAGRLIRTCAELDVNGAVEVEMIYRDGTYHVIEINPRVSGTTLLSSVASDRNTYAELLQMALGAWREPRSALLPGARWALEFPVVDPTPSLIRDATAMIDVVRAGALRISGQDHGGNMVVSCEFREEGPFVKALDELNDRHRFLEPGILQQIHDALSA
ncbi:ATP-grasp domain-containing protein [Nonomuraea diastatica]|uniref:ATP-grasp domain-containing protein n=1 Tax=Nonomuraea diastatica TaxID=1848329 RepID=A0A4R4WBV1_9ACTN|nr:ATP-grasp domain-containing protein [Nonomuraea diastatica]TDD14607.1 ATP-grasp domain-containing protein [Nonomuraea diastatica]